MLRFSLPDRFAGVLDPVARRAHLLGQDDVCMPGEVRVIEGEIACASAPGEAAALCLEIPLEGLGARMLQTCLLPPRDKPYRLALELARHRLMLYLAKLEDWLHEDVAPDDAAALFERAQELFSAALAVLPDSAQAAAKQDELATRALRIGMEATDALAFAMADRGSAQRDAASRAQREASGGRPFRPSIGIASPCGKPTPAQQAAISKAADFLVAPAGWKELAPDEGQADFTCCDAWVRWAAQEARMPVAGGPLLDFRPGRAPQWALVWKNDYATLREVAFDHIRAVVSRYARVVWRWTPVSGAHMNADFHLTLEQMLDLTRLAAMVVRKAQPSAKIHLEIDQPFGEWIARRPNSVPPLLYAEMVAQHGAAIDAIDLRIEAGPGPDLPGERDAAALSSMLDRFRTIQKPMGVVLSAPSEGDGWTPEHQAAWLERCARVALGKPYVVSLAWDGLADSPTPEGPESCPRCGLLDHRGNARPALDRLTDLRASLRTPGEANP